MDKNMKVAVYFRTATTPIDKSLALRQFQTFRANRGERFECGGHEIIRPCKMALFSAGVSTDTSRQLPPMERPGVQEMLSAVREGKAGAVMMPSLHHLGRDFDAILPVLAEFQKQKVHIHAKDASALSLPLSQKPPSKRKGGDAR